MSRTSDQTNRQAIASSSCRRLKSRPRAVGANRSQSAHAGQGGEHLLLEEFHRPQRPLEREIAECESPEQIVDAGLFDLRKETVADG